MRAWCVCVGMECNIFTGRICETGSGILPGAPRAAARKPHVGRAMASKHAVSVSSATWNKYRGPRYAHVAALALDKRGAMARGTKRCAAAPLTLAKNLVANAPLGNGSAVKQHEFRVVRLFG